jgi:hypothetical protein
MKAKKNSNSLSAAVERLRASKLKFDEEQYTAGERDGREWAVERAEAEELIRLAAWKNQCSRDWDAMFQSDDQSAYGPSQNLVFAIWPEHNGDREPAGEFWEGESGNEYPADEYLRGFANAAIEAWEEIEPQL